jgi:thiol-disulfide isomerase/thioredoxin
MPRIPAVFLLGLTLTACTTATAGNVAVFEEAEREPAPSLAGPSLLESLPVESVTRGRPSVVNFWGSWCGPCREEQPLFVEAYEKLSHEVSFIGVNTRNDQPAAAKAFLDEFEVPYGSVFDPNSEIAIEFGVRVMPATFILDEEGRIAAQIIGAVRSVAQIEDLIKQASQS